MTDDIIAKAEENVRQRAIKAAYLCSEKFDNSETQKAVYTAVQRLYHARSSHDAGRTFKTRDQ